ncbi:MAG: hypothetical protein ACRDJH_09825, partial [Thermomicrobiales bacterium]
IMVRKGELACRDGWSRDLWAPRNDAGAPGPESDETRQRPLPPISPEEMSVLVDNGQVELDASLRSSTPAPVDVVVGESPVLPLTDDRATLLSHDPRAAIEAARKRHAAKSSAAERSDPALDVESAESGDSERVTDGRSASGATIVWRPNPIQPARDSTPAPVRSNVAPPAGPASTAHREERDHFSSVPDHVAGVDLPRANMPSMAPPVAGAAQDLPEDPRRLSLQRLRERQSRSGVAPALLRRNPLSPAREPEDDPIQDGEGHARSWRGLRGRNVRALTVDDEAVEPLWDEDVQEDFEGAPAALEDELHAAFESALVEHEIEAPGTEDDFAYALAGGFDEDFDIGDTAVHVAPNVPRMCRTCRDFRPADSGERGWCNNNWAFSHRRMVDADELPCESSLGCWWLPHDDIWLSTADAAAHSKPTPLVDQWLNRRDGAARRRQGS